MFNTSWAITQRNSLRISVCGREDTRILLAECRIWCDDVRLSLFHYLELLLDGIHFFLKLSRYVFLIDPMHIRAVRMDHIAQRW